MVSALASINEVNVRRARLVLRWETVSGFNSRCRTFISVCNQPPKANSVAHPSGVGKWVPASAGKAKAGMVYSVSGWTRGVQVKLWDHLRTHAIPERLRGVFMTRHYTNTRLPLIQCKNYTRHEWLKEKQTTSSEGSYKCHWKVDEKPCCLTWTNPAGRHSARDLQAMETNSQSVLL